MRKPAANRPEKSPSNKVPFHASKASRPPALPYLRRNLRRYKPKELAARPSVYLR